MSGCVIELTWPEVLLAANGGVMRRVTALRKGLSGRYGATDEGAWDHDVNGALAELAVAKWAGVFWSGTIGRIDLPDVGTWQVRSKVRPEHRLVVRPDDADDAVFISVLVRAPQCVLCGWLYGDQAKQAQWIVSKDRPPMYFVPESELTPMERLPCPRRAA